MRGGLQHAGECIAHGSDPSHCASSAAWSTAGDRRNGTRFAGAEDARRAAPGDPVLECPEAVLWRRRKPGIHGVDEIDAERSADEVLVVKARGCGGGFGHGAIVTDQRRLTGWRPHY